MFIALSALFLIAFFALFLRLSDSLRMKKRQGFMPWRVAPQVRLELTTLRLTAECSAIELLRIIRGLWRDSFGCPAACCQLPALLRLALAHAPASHCASASRSLRLGFAARLARLPLAAPPPRSSLCFGSGKNFRSSRSSWIPATSYSPKPFPAQYHQRLEA